MFSESISVIQLLHALDIVHALDAADAGDDAVEVIDIAGFKDDVDGGTEPPVLASMWRMLASSPLMTAETWVIMPGRSSLETTSLTG